MRLHLNNIKNNYIINKVKPYQHTVAVASRMRTRSYLYLKGETLKKGVSLKIFKKNLMIL